MIQHYLTVALRNLLKNKGQTLISIAGLAVGLLSFALCTYLIRYWMDTDNDLKNKKQIAEIVIVSDRGERLTHGTPAYLAQEIRDKQLDIIKYLTRASFNNIENYSFEITEDKTLPYEIYVAETDTNFIKVFDRKLLSGDLKSINSQPNILLLSQSASKKIYGDKNPIGEKVTGEDLKIYTIGGIFEDFPQNNSFSPYNPIEVLTVSVLNGFLEKQIKDITGCKTYALLHLGHKPKDLDKLLDNLKLTADYSNGSAPVKALSLGDKDPLGMKPVDLLIRFIELFLLHYR